MKKHLLATALLAISANEMSKEMMSDSFNELNKPKFKRKALLSKKQTKSRNKAKAARKAKRKNRK